MHDKNQKPHGSKLTSWWHNFVDKLNVSPGTKETLHTYGPVGLWVGMIVGGIVVFKILF